MSELDKNETQGQDPKHTYQNQDWIHVYEWMTQRHENGETHEPFWSVVLPSNTFLEKDGQRIDVSHYRFTTSVEPALTSGEPGTPKAMRGIHFPDGWDISLQLVQNVAVEGHEPIFEVTDRIDGVTAKQLSEAMTERNAAWRSSHRHDRGEKIPDKEAQSLSQKHMRPGRGMYFAGEDAQKPKRSAEPSL